MRASSIRTVQFDAPREYSSQSLRPLGDVVVCAQKNVRDSRMSLMHV